MVKEKIDIIMSIVIILVSMMSFLCGYAIRDLDIIQKYIGDWSILF